MCVCMRVCAYVCSGDGGDGLEKEEEEAAVALEGGTPIIVYFSSFAVTINYIICGAKY